MRFSSRTAAVRQRKMVRIPVKVLLALVCSIHVLQCRAQEDEGVDYYQPGSATEDCLCVPLYQCVDGKIVNDGSNILDPRKLPKPKENEEEGNEEIVEEEEGGVEEIVREDGTKECGPFHICCGGGGSTDVEPPYQHKCGTRNTGGITGRILNSDMSNNAEFGEFPWQAAILKKEADEFVFKCAGTLIDETHVLTIAHCVQPFLRDQTSLVVRLGEWDLEAETKDEYVAHENHEVSNIIIHSQYKSNNLYNDIAVLELADKVVFKPHIDTVCLPREDDDFTGQECIVTGWGTDAYQGNYSTILKEVTVPVLGHRQCQDMLRKTRLGRFFKLHEGFLCAGGQEGVDACKGDGGGPLVCLKSDNSYTLAGLVAWGIDCGQPGVPGVYVNVKKYIDWIASTTDKRLEDYWSVD